MTTVLNILIPLLVGRAGAFFQWAIAALIGWLSPIVLSYGIEISPELWAQLQAGLMAISLFLVHVLVQWYQASQARKIQSTLGEVFEVKVDSWLGTQTVESAETVVALANDARRF